MQVTQRKEDISISYISALCAYSGISYEIVRHDDDSTDGILRFSGKPETQNTAAVSIRIEKDHVLNTESLNQILKKIAREEWP